MPHAYSSRHAPWIIAAVTCLALTGCGKEVGRVPFAGEDTKTVTLPLAAGDVAFWTDVDVKYEGAAALVYRIELSQGGSSVDKLECDPLGNMSVKVGWIETRFNQSRSRSGKGKMACSASLKAGGPTSVRATLAFDTRPTSVTLTQADLVLKQ